MSEIPWLCLTLLAFAYLFRDRLILVQWKGMKVRIGYRTKSAAARRKRRG
jgi:hypothetical protein